VVARGVHSWLAAAFKSGVAVGTIAFSFALAVVVFPAAANLLLMRRRRSWPATDSRGDEATQP
jgi:hypothetical protein